MCTQRVWSNVKCLSGSHVVSLSFARRERPSQFPVNTGLLHSSGSVEDGTNPGGGLLWFFFFSSKSKELHFCSGKKALMRSLILRVTRGENISCTARMPHGVFGVLSNDFSLSLTNEMPWEDLSKLHWSAQIGIADILSANSPILHPNPRTQGLSSPSMQNPTADAPTSPQWPLLVLGEFLYICVYM